MPGVFLLAPGPVFIDPDQQTVHNNAAVNADGEEVYTGASAFVNSSSSSTSRQLRQG